MLDGRYPARVVGPLATEVPRFRTELIRLGFTPRTAQGNAYVRARLSWWLEAENLAPAELTTVQVERFIEARRAFGFRRWLTVQALSKHLGYLRQMGLVPQPEPEEINAVERVVLDFGAYCVGSADWPSGQRVSGWMSLAGSCGRCRRRAGYDWIDCKAADVIAFIVAASRRYSTASMKVTTTSVRSLLRYLFATAATNRDWPTRCRRSPAGG